jgi:transcriptional antiterminator
VQTIQIPEGYKAIIVPILDAVSIIQYKNEWDKIDMPTIQEVAAYVKVSTRQILLDLKKPNCPLHVLNDGAKGRGKQKTFLKLSAEEYKKSKNFYN